MAKRRLVLCLLVAVALVVGLGVVWTLRTSTGVHVDLPVADKGIGVTVRDTGTRSYRRDVDRLATSVPISNVYDIQVDREPSIALLGIPLSRAELTAAAEAHVDPSNLYIGLYDDTLGWLPLASRFDSRTKTIQALAPHLSRAQVFGWLPTPGQVVSTVKDTADAAGQAIVQAGKDAARAAGGALSDFADAEVNGVRIISSWFISFNKGVTDAFNEVTSPAQEGSGCEGAKAAPGVSLTSNVRYLEGCVLAQKPNEISVANHGFLPFRVGGRAGLSADSDVSDDSDLGMFIADLVDHADHRQLIAGHRARQLTMSADLKTDRDWQAHADPAVLELVMNAISSLLSVVPPAARVREVVLTLRVQIAERVEADGARTVQEVLVSVEHTVRDAPAVPDKGPLLEQLDSVKEAFSCGAAYADALTEEKASLADMTKDVLTAVRACVPPFVEKNVRTTSGFFGSYLNSLVEGGATAIRDVLGAWEATTLRDAFDSRIEVSTTSGGGASDDHPPPVPANVWLPYDVQDPTAHPLQEPREFNATGDSSLWFTDMSWTQWSSSEAAGTGTSHVSCKSSCQPGEHPGETPGAAVQLDRPIDVCGRAYYSRVRVEADRQQLSMTFLAEPVSCPKPRNPHVHLFVSPTGNIRCGTFMGADGSTPPWGSTRRIGCSIQEHDYGPHAADCPYDGAYADLLDRSGKAQVLPCSGDALVAMYGTTIHKGASPEKTSYDQNVDLDAATCSVKVTGVRCVNKDGHGFVLSRQSNKTF